MSKRRNPKGSLLRRICSIFISQRVMCSISGLLPPPLHAFTVMSPSRLPRALRALAMTVRVSHLTMVCNNGISAGTPIFHDCEEAHRPKQSMKWGCVAVCKKYVTLISLLLMILPLQGGCLFYSFSGSSLSKEAKTFTLQEFQSKVALGPPSLAEQLTQKLREAIAQKTPLKETINNGDIQFDGVITKLVYTPIAPRSTSDGTTSSRTQLSITVQVKYTNIYDKDFEFSKKDFTQTTDVEAGEEYTQENSMAEEVVRKLIQDIFNASIANW